MKIIIILVIFTFLCVYIIVPLCNVPFVSRLSSCRHINRLYDFAEATQRLVVGDNLGSLSNSPHPPHDKEFLGIQLATRELIPLVESSGLPSRAQLSAVLFKIATDLVEIRSSLHHLGATIEIGTEEILAVVEHCQSLVSYEWLGPDSIICVLMGSVVFQDTCAHGRRLHQALYLDVRHVSERSTRDMISSIGSVMHHLATFDRRLLELHRLALTDGIHVNGTQYSLLQELWSFIGRSVDHRTQAYNSAILRRTEQHVRVTTSYTFYIIGLVQEIHTHTAIAQGAMSRLSSSTPGLKVVHATARKLREMNNIDGL
ncbi:hypothetical protein PLEOSDRAFT_1109813 [Pleurotus ostreatus PC15]|uniref:Uncharacterized protein n=1 Tax=Pleurotus ostreatus (strain PC15) TaxID=1137138 RepID=A0A067NF30_PLEO1|nr:hypothetical protein PLEOSDRAFT_1109813 [Pleurotus ostreatus PC15]